MNRPVAILGVVLVGMLGGTPAAPAHATPIVSSFTYAGAAAVAPPALERPVFTAASDSTSPKTAIATCSVGKRILGGGGTIAVTSNPADAFRVAITRLEPVHTTGSGPDSYVVTAEELGTGTTGNWAVTAIAICAPPPSGYEVVSSSTFPSSAAVHETSAGCSGSKNVIGTGAQVNNPAGRVTLQLNRPDGPSKISRVTAKETTAGHPLVWNTTSYAVCTNPLPDFKLEGDISDTTEQEPVKAAFVTCPAGKFVHGAHAATSGGSGLTTTPAGVAIQEILPSADLRSVTVRARATTGSAPGNWDLVAQASCAP
jgi:hypothetical protein